MKIFADGFVVEHWYYEKDGERVCTFLDTEDYTLDEAKKIIEKEQDELLNYRRENE